MLELSRTVKFCVNAASLRGLDTARHNTFASWPAMRGLGRYYELAVTCEGEADPQTGYFINIKMIDQAVRDHVVPVLAAQVDEDAVDPPLGSVMQRMLQVLQPALDGTVTALTWSLTPTYRLSYRSESMSHVTLHQSYEFSAAHRLHVDAYSEAQNREVFGKCNNPAGHGHNYRVDVSVRVPIDPQGRVLTAEALDQVVDEHCIQKLDHKHLNKDVPAFASLNPSVENIVKVVWGMLTQPVAAMAEGVGLEEIRVWETGKTVCAYRGE